MIKKILTGILTASMIASFAVLPVSADYENSIYDKEYQNIVFEDGTAENPIDGSKALNFADVPAEELNYYEWVSSGKTTIVEGYKELFTSTFDTTKGFFLSFDFCIDETNKDSALIELPQYNSGHSKIDKIGPIISYGDVTVNKQTVQQLRTQTGSSSYQALGEITLGEWYSAEIEGRTGIGAQYTTFRLYSYSNGNKELVQETKGFNMRNISNENKSFNTMQIKKINVDNIMLTAINPNRIDVTSDFDEVSAGQSIAMDYTMFRGDTEFTKHNVIWSINGTNVSIDDSGVIIADITAANQTVTVTATATINEQELVGTKDIIVKSVDTASEKFDTITISGIDSLKAGTSADYTFTAKKNGVDVTNTVTADDVIWSICDYSGFNPYYDDLYKNTKAIEISNGHLTVADGLIKQNIQIKASSASGKVYGLLPVSIDFSESQTENVITSDAYDTALSADSKAVSVDGSTAFLVTSQDGYNKKFGNQEGYTLTEIDVKFTTEGSGIAFARNDFGSESTSVKYKSGSLATNKGVVFTDAELNKWYHLEILYSTTDASCNIYPYNEDGTLGKAQTSLDIDRRNSATHGSIMVTTGTCVDNLKISKPLPYELELSAPKENLFPDETLEISAIASRNGLPLKDTEGISWSVLDEGNLPIIDGTITINESGVLKVTPLALAQKIKVQAKTATGAVATFDVNIQSGDIFTITNIGINEDKTKVVKLYVDKNFNYSDSVVFFIAVYDDNDVLQGLTHLNRFGDTLNIGENEIPLDYTLPAGFDPETDKITVMAWTALS